MSALNNAFGASDNTINNLALISARAATVAEQRLLELYDLTAAALDRSAEYAADGLAAYDLISAIMPDEQDAPPALPDGIPAPLAAPALSYLSALSAIDRATVAFLYARGAHERALPVSERDLLPCGDGPETCIYARNTLADEAYDVLSQEFADPRVKYATTLADCVRAVISGECRFCLLPLEEKGGTRLPTVAELIYRGDLKINAVTPVFGFDGTADLKYALLSRDFLIPTAVEGDDRYLEVRVGADDDRLTELFSVLGYLGLTLYRVNTVTFTSEGESESYLSLVLRDGGDGFTPILVYLSLFSWDFTPVGIYKNLE